MQLSTQKLKIISEE